MQLKKKGSTRSCAFIWTSGLGKTTLANIIANEMDSNIKITTGPAITKPGELSSNTHCT